MINYLFVQSLTNKNNIVIMCGIFAILGLTNLCLTKQLRRYAIHESKKMKHRGPDWCGYYMHKNVILCHERLSIIDVYNGAQPITSKDDNIILTVNGEIYNYKQLGGITKESFKTNSDCEIIIHLYKKYGRHFMKRNMMKGMFAFVLYDKLNEIMIIARDHLGIIPLYRGYDMDSPKYLYISSEMKSLVNSCSHISVCEPGTYSIISTEKISSNNINPFSISDVQYYNPSWYHKIGTHELNLTLLRETLEASVKSHMMSDVPFGLLLSGGLDSSLIASIAQRYTPNKLKTFCIGLTDSPDLKAAEEVAQFIDSDHYSFKYTIQEGLDALEDTIYHIESCDITTVRSSVPMYLLARRIRALGIKFVLTGEVSDEINGSYSYFKYAPNKKEFYDETLVKVKNLYKYDLLRANKAMLAWSVETRVPFGDQSMLDVVMNLDPKYKMWNNDGIEKSSLRMAFDDKKNPYLSNNILWRVKEQFSDGVGYGWINSLKEYANITVNDAEIKNATDTYPINTPRTKEEYLYRKLFNKYYYKDTCIKTLIYEDSIACSSGKAIKWFDKSQIIDPSGRVVE